MRVAKIFGWEAAHRLPAHDGLCRHLHGHSYRMRVEMVGDPDEHGIVMDFHEMKALIKPLVDEWDHSTLVSHSDTELLDMVRRLGDRHVVLSFESTAENLCIYVADYVLREGREMLKRRRISGLRVRIHETETCFAEHEASVR